MEPQKTEIAGDRLGDIETFERVKRILVDFLRGYPAWKYYGIFEFYFKPEISHEIIQQLTNDDILKLWTLNIKGQNVLGYSLTGKGAQLASSLSTKRKIDILKWIGVVLAGIGIIVGLAQLVLNYAQQPIF